MPCRASRAATTRGLKSIWIEGRSEGVAWESQDKYAKEFEHPLWTNLAEKAQGSGHGGADFFVVYDFLRDGPPTADRHRSTSTTPPPGVRSFPCRASRSPKGEPCRRSPTSPAANGARLESVCAILWLTDGE